MLVREPGFTLTAAILLALGIGATTAVYSLLDRLLFEPLAYPESGRLVWIQGVSPKSGTGFGPMLGGDYQELHDHMRNFENVAGFIDGNWTVTGDGGEAERLSGARVTAAFFRDARCTAGSWPGIFARRVITTREIEVIFSDPFW